VQEVHKMYILYVLVAYLFQFENYTMLTSPLLSLVIGSMIAKSLQ
ncbi:hypothetical protein XELAEV_180322517mg, partial [Xenopus laevis]